MPADPDDECIADDITECDCSRCNAAELAHEHVNGGHGTDDPDYHEDGCPECEREGNVPLDWDDALDDEDDKAADGDDDQPEDEAP